jgi:hypothetical protein
VTWRAPRAGFGNSCRTGTPARIICRRTECSACRHDAVRRARRLRACLTAGGALTSPRPGRYKRVAAHDCRAADRKHRHDRNGDSYGFEVRERESGRSVPIMWRQLERCSKSSPASPLATTRRGVARGAHSKSACREHVSTPVAARNDQTDPVRSGRG